MQAVARSADPGEVIATAVLRAADRLELTGADLARVIGVSPATVSRLSKSGQSLREHSKPAELALLLIRAYRSLRGIVPSDEHAAQWFQAHNTALGGVPAESVQTAEGLVDVVRYLDAMRARV